MSAKDEQMDSVITAFELTLTNLVAEPEMAAIMQARGFPQERIDAGRALVQAARAKQQARQTELGAQLQATAAFKEAFATASKAYADFRETARAHFKSASANPDPWQALGLTGLAPRTIESFVNTAYNTFDNALASQTIVDALTPYGYDRPKVSAARALVAAANQAQERAKGAALGTTSKQKDAYEQAKDWMSAFKRIAGAARSVAKIGDGGSCEK